MCHKNGGKVHSNKNKAFVSLNKKVTTIKFCFQIFSFVLVKTMTREKVKLEFNVNDAARKATYKKTKKGLLNKVDELSILCRIEVRAIVYDPYEP